MRSDLLVLVAAAAFLPLVYLGVLYYYRSCFAQECNQKRRFLRTLPEKFVFVLSEAAVIRVWYSYTSEKLSGLMLLMLIIMLYGMTILCMTDYWEKVVPNRILLLWMMCWILVMGIYGVRDLNAMMRHMFGVILGLVFCILSFGFCYLISKGSMGAGDVKLAVIMGIYLTGDYVVGAVFYGCILSAVFSIWMLARGKMTRKDSIPFVPFLYMGVIIRYFIG